MAIFFIFSSRGDRFEKGPFFEGLRAGWRENHLGQDMSGVNGTFLHFYKNAKKSRRRPINFLKKF